MKIVCGLNHEMEMNASTYKNMLYLKNAKSKICINLDTGELVKSGCHCVPGLSKIQLQKIVAEVSRTATK